MSKKNSPDVVNMKRMEYFNFDLAKEYSRLRIFNNEYSSNENMIEEYKKYKNLGFNHKDACKKIGTTEYKFARMLKDMNIPSLNRHSVPVASSKKSKKTKEEPNPKPIRKSKSKSKKEVVIASGKKYVSVVPSDNEDDHDIIDEND